jgi:hypothetical protein
METKAPKALVIPTPKVVEDALALAGRFRDVHGLQKHVGMRRPLLRGAAALLVAQSLACGAGTFLFLAGLSTSLTLPAVLLAPLVVLGSLLVHFYVFYSWIEGRALAQALGHRTGPRPGKLRRAIEKKLRLDLGAMPAVPWLAAAIFVALPFVLLAAAVPAGAILFLLVAVGLPLVYARLDAS